MELMNINIIGISCLPRQKGGKDRIPVPFSCVFNLILNKSVYSLCILVGE